MALFLAPSPFEGEGYQPPAVRGGWDGGRTYNQALNPRPSPPVNQR